MQATQRQGVIGIDLLRVFAALAVMLFHLGFKAFASADGIVPQQLGSPAALPGGWQLSWWGWVGVQVFFVVSGLVIAFSASAPGLTAGRFLRRRVLRLVPVVLIAAIFAAAIEVAWFGMDPGRAAGLWLRTISFQPFQPWIMGQFWTIGIEIGFYVLVCALVAVRAVRFLPWLGLVLVLASAAYWAARMAGGGTDEFPRLTQLALLQHGACFGIGILLADRAARGPRGFQIPGVVLGCAVAGVQIWRAAIWEAGAEGLAPLWPVAWAVFVGAVALAALSLTYNAALLAWLGPRAPLIRTVGLMTYPLYLIHNHAGKPVLVEALRAGVPPVLALAAAMAVAVGLAVAIVLWIEPPVRALLARLIDRATALRTRAAGGLGGGGRTRPSG